MEEFDDQLRDLKREIIESRGMIIKTNNLTNALAADLKSIGKRQHNSERRAFWNSAAANLLFVVVVIVVVKFAWDSRVDSVEQETKTSKARVAQLTEELAEQQKHNEDRAQAETAAAAFYELVRADNKREMIDAYQNVRKEQLTRAEQAFFRDAVERARSQLSVSSYHEGLDHMRAGRWDEALAGFEDSTHYSDTASHAPAARLNLAKTYRRLNRQRDAVPILVKLSEASADAEILDDAMFLLAECLVDIHAYNDARTTLRNFIRRYPRSPYINDAKMALADLQVRR